MNSIYKSKFWTKCPCKEFENMTIYKDLNHSCPMCGNSFIMKEYQGNSQLQVLWGELGHYHSSNRQLHFEIKRENYFYGLIEKDDH